MKLLLFVLLLCTTSAFSQGQSRRLWISGDLAYAATSPTRNTDRPLGNMILGLTIEQELPYRLSLVTGYKIRSYSASIPDLDIQTRMAWEYSGIGYSRSYAIVPLQVRWQLPIFKWNVTTRTETAVSTLYVSPHAGMDLNIGRRAAWFFGTEKSTLEEVVNIHKEPENLFATGQIGLSLGFELLELVRMEAFVAYTFRGGRLIDFSLNNPYIGAQTYSGYNTLQAGFRISVSLVDWKRTAADRAATKARDKAYKQAIKQHRTSTKR